MLVRSTGPLHTGLHLLTLGNSCHYALETGSGIAIFDPGLSAHIPMLLKRLEALGYSSGDISHIFLTNLLPERCGGLPLLLRSARNAEVHAGNNARELATEKSLLANVHSQDQAISKRFRFVKDSDLLSAGEYLDNFKVHASGSGSELLELSEEAHVRFLAFPGQTSHSTAYFVELHQYIVLDSGAGYFRGKDLCSPGAEFSIEAGLNSIDALSNIEYSGICFPVNGTITGELARSYPAKIRQNTEDLVQECENARAAGVSEDEIKEAIKDSFYSLELPDPLLEYLFDRSFAAIWKQICKAEPTS